MPLNLPTYCTREDVKAAADFAFTSRENARVDRAIDSVSRLIEGELHRVFYPRDTTFKFDWPLHRTTSTPTRGSCTWTSGTWCR